LRRRALRSKGQQPQNVVERNRTKAHSADCGFAEPSRRKAAYSYRLLGEVGHLQWLCLFK